ncbi:cation diffusion facilitator family transporter [Aminipila terrae]|uniref:Cation diffusion facilitator family transporter n=1 Tax=Aminipila terrae TaxID=2697030 RepID=A0A6P1MLD7_9FIRM|nr:cation diffusion facilitator family transporter [Aminipila terrae]QHI71795.1 cation diffusion facilitator family transporter [Aminipila terrae]
MSKLNRKSKVALLSVLSNTMLIILKIVAGLLSGSVSIISEAIHSSMDLIASVIALFSVSVSSKPADKQHPYGHGKIENISGVIEGLLIFIAAFLIIKESIQKILNPSEISGVSIGIVVMGIASVSNLLVSRALYKVAKQEDSIALEADALHLKTDVYTSLGVAAGLLLIKLTGIAILDPIVAMLVALLIIKEAWALCSDAFGPLLDTCLPDEDEKRIQDIIDNFSNVTGCHSLRTRKSGHYKYIDLHLVVKGEISVAEAHGICDEIEKTIEDQLINTSINIHVEPEEITTED